MNASIGRWVACHIDSAAAWYALANNADVIPSSQQIALGPTGTRGAFEDPSRWIRGVLDLRP
jgi:hypothetical protein